MHLSGTNHFYNHLITVTIFHSIIHFCCISFIYLSSPDYAFFKISLAISSSILCKSAVIYIWQDQVSKYTGWQEGYYTKTAQKQHTHTHVVNIKQSTVLVYTVHSTIIYKYFSTDSKKDRGKNIILICK
jgi:hypothetical protein